MKKVNQWLVTLCVTVPTWGPAWAQPPATPALSTATQPAQPPATSAPSTTTQPAQSTGAPPATQSPQPPDEFGEKLSSQERSSEEFFLPSINELYMQAKLLGVSGDWDKQVQLVPKDYKSMELPRRSFEVGKTLSHIAFIVLNTGNSESPPPKGIVQQAYDAILSLEPPAQIHAQLQRLRDQLEAGTLQGKALRSQVDNLIDQTLLDILEQEPKSRDSGTLVLGAGYFTAMYLGAKTVAGYPNPTQDQLRMFLWGKLIDYFINYFTTKADESFKNSPEVRSFVVALKKIQPALAKAPEALTKEDINQVAQALAPLFK